VVVGGAESTAEASGSIAIGKRVRISESAQDAVVVSAYRSSSSKSCATGKPGSLTLCADNSVTIQALAGSALVVNGVDVLSELADLKAKVAALMLTLKPTTKAPAAKPTTKAPQAKPTT
jgi:hypothetical protein